MRRLIVKTRLTGHFQGFETNQVLQLQNGDTWQQDAVKRRYSYRYRPKATLWRDADRYYMDIEGMHELIKVHRVEPRENACRDCRPAQTA
jgi:hypothetical protein